ncbi:sirohydrochlorin chelatase [Streptomyces sp. JJ36]|uniref:sirohydrochlorin chelatase n=1 Tax=Streptomyces sp. JJ36 TaxID=2736645 RepID=UPI001F241452|nr:sirohydrochlorin chelatase [Streptomyces sp. JJ36]
MTASRTPDHVLGPSSAPPDLESTAQLMSRLTAQLHTQLGTLRPAPAAAADSPLAPTLVAVAHGSRDPRAGRTVRALLERVRALRPGLRVEAAHIELNEPLLADTLAALPDGSRAVLVPLLFGRGYHVKHDLPAAPAAAPHLDAVQVAAPLGPHPLLARALHDRLREAGWPERRPAPGTAGGGRCAGEPGAGGEHPAGSSRDAVVLAAAGSRDPESAAGTEAGAALLSDRLGGVPVVPAYASAAQPTVPEAVARLRRDGYRRIGLASYFTAPGYFATQCAEAAPGVVAAPLGAHPALARLVLHRYDLAVAAGPHGPYRLAAA